jgi:hypothetical protein
MAIIKTNGAYYKEKKDVLKAFSITVKAYMKGYYQLANEKRILFFHLPVHNPQGGYDITGANEQWINIPDGKNWQAFTQIELNKCEKNHDFENAFKKDKVAQKEQAVFFKNANGYQFYGIYKAELGKRNSGICLYHRIHKTVNTTTWIL